MTCIASRIKNLRTLYLLHIQFCNENVLLGADFCWFENKYNYLTSVLVLPHAIFIATPILPAKFIFAFKLKQQVEVKGIY